MTLDPQLRVALISWVHFETERLVVESGDFYLRTQDRLGDSDLPTYNEVAAFTVEDRVRRNQNLDK